MNTTYQLLVRYVDGTENIFALSPESETWNMAARMQEVIEAPMLILELHDRALMIPYHRIAAIEIIPSPPKLPAYTTRKVKLIK